MASPHSDSSTDGLGATNIAALYDDFEETTLACCGSIKRYAERLIHTADEFSKACPESDVGMTFISLKFLRDLTPEYLEFKTTFLANHPVLSASIWDDLVEEAKMEERAQQIAEERIRKREENTITSVATTHYHTGIGASAREKKRSARCCTICRMRSHDTTRCRKLAEVMRDLRQADDRSKTPGRDDVDVMSSSERSSR
jgi:hypothetical protein